MPAAASCKPAPHRHQPRSRPVRHGGGRHLAGQRRARCRTDGCPAAKRGYHREVFDRLVEVTQGKSGDAYTQAFQRELAKIGKEIQTPGTKLNNLVTKK